MQNTATDQILRINTYTTRADGITHTTREASAALKIQNLTPGDQFMMIPKATGVATGAAAVGITGNANAADGSSSGITWGSIGNFLMDLLILGGVGNAGGAGDTMPQGAQSSIGVGAAVGFLLYPNKPNTNQMQSVYSKGK